MSERTPLENPNEDLADLLKSGWQLTEDKTAIEKEFQIQKL